MEKQKELTAFLDAQRGIARGWFLTYVNREQADIDRENNNQINPLGERLWPGELMHGHSWVHEVREPGDPKPPHEWKDCPESCVD